jgi:CelD/BcsL family acetyltransferase involved in cellulose biosynthesis
MISCQAHTTAGAFDTLADEWRALLKTLPFDTLFYTPEWQRLTYGEFNTGAPYLVAVRDDATLIGLAPLMFTADNATLEFACYKEISDYLDLLATAGREQDVFGALTAWLLGPDAPAWRTLSLTNVRAASPTMTQFADYLRNAGLSVEITPEDVCPVIPLPASLDGYLEKLDGRERRELQRKLRRATDESAVAVSPGGAALEADVNDFIALMKASMFTKNDFMTPRMEIFFQKMAAAMDAAGWLELSFLEVGDEAPRSRAAAYVNFVYNNQVLVYNSGLDPAKFAHLSPGQVLIGRLIERAIEQKRTAFDFLQGNESYKYKLGGIDVPLQTLTAQR